MGIKCFKSTKGNGQLSRTEQDIKGLPNAQWFGWAGSENRVLHDDNSISVRSSGHKLRLVDGHFGIPL